MTLVRIEPEKKAEIASLSLEELDKRFSALPIYLKLDNIGLTILYQQGPRCYTHQCSNLVSSTFAIQAKKLSGRSILLSQHLNPDINFLPQLEVKISRLLHSHFISLVLFYDSRHKGYRPCIDQTCLQIGEGLGEEREGLHSNLLPGLNIEWESPKNYKTALQHSYIQYLEFHFGKCKALCEKYADKNHIPTKQSMATDIEYLDMNPFRNRIETLNLEITKCEPPRFRKESQKKEGDTFNRFATLKESLDTINQLLKSNIESPNTQNLDEIREKCENILSLVNFLYLYSYYLRPSIRCSSLQANLKDSHYYAENNRVDDMPGFLNQWDESFLESEFRPFAIRQLKAASKKTSSPHQLAEEFVKRLQGFLSSTKKSMRHDIYRYQQAAQTFEELKKQEKELIQFFRRPDLAEKSLEGFDLLKRFFEIFTDFDSHIEFLKTSRITPGRQTVKELLKTYGDHKKSLIMVYRELFLLAKYPTFEDLDVLIKERGSFDSELWAESANKIKEQKKSPWSDLLTNIQRSLHTADLNPYEALRYIDTIFKKGGQPENIARLPYILSSLEAPGVIPYEARGQIQEVAWQLLLDHVKYLVSIPAEERSFGENVFLELLDVTHLDLNLKTTLILEGPYLLTEVELTSMGQSLVALQNCIASLEGQSENSEANKLLVIRSLETLIKEFPTFPQSNYGTELQIFTSLRSSLLETTLENYPSRYRVTLKTLQHFLSARQNAAFKTAANILNQLGKIIPSKPIDVSKKKGNYFSHVYGKGQIKLNHLDAFNNQYLKDQKRLKEDVESGQFFFNAAALERCYPGAIHPIQSKKEISDISPERLGPALVSKLKQFYVEKNFKELNRLFTIHHLDEHQFVKEFRDCENDAERIQLLIEKTNHETSPLSWCEVLQNAFTDTFQKLIDESDLQALECRTKTLLTYYQEVDCKEAVENYHILNTRFELAGRLIHAFKELMHEPLFTDNEISRLFYMTGEGRVQSIVEGVFFKNALTFFTNKIYHTPKGNNSPLTHGGVLGIWAKMYLFSQIGSRKLSELHLTESVNRSIQSGPLINGSIVDEVDVSDCLISNPFEEYQLAVRNFDDIHRQVIPYYEELLEEFDDTSDYEGLIKQLVINELDLNDFLGIGHDTPQEARKLFHDLPIEVLASMLTPTVVKRQNKYQIVPIEKDSKLFQTLFANPATFVIIDGKVSDLIQTKPFCEMEFLRELNPGKNLTVINFKPNRQSVS